MTKISTVQLLDRKDGKGKVARIEFADISTGARASRLYHESFASLAKTGDDAEGVEVKQVSCAPYSFKNAAGETIQTDKKTIAILKNESEATALAKSTPKSKVSVAADVRV